MSSAATRFIRAMCQYDEAAFARLIGQGMGDAHIRAKAVEFALHLAVTRRAGANAPLDVAGILTDAQAFLGFLQGRRLTRRRPASSDPRKASRKAARSSGVRK